MSNKLDELKKKYEELGKEIKRLEIGERWRGEKGNIYYYIDDDGYIYASNENKDSIDDYRYKTRNYFKTEEEAQAYLDNINTYYELMDLAEELNNGEEINWDNNNQVKYLLVYDFYEKKIKESLTFRIKDLGQIYCLDKNFLEKAIERIGKEKLEKLFKNSMLCAELVDKYSKKVIVYEMPKE